MSEFQDQLLERLDKHTELLSSISTDIALLKKSDDRLADDYEGIMEKIERLEGRVRNLELKLAFASVLGTLVAAIGGALAYLLSK